MELPILDLCGSHDDQRIDIGTTDGKLAVPDDVGALLGADAPVAIGVSGGKDSCAVAIAVKEELDRSGHKGPQLLIHADLGRTEWKDSLPTCQRLSERLGLELVVVKREKGDMMDRWLQRWDDNVTRYCELSCVKLILPWSTPSMRFCTSELKIQVITRYLTMERWSDCTILNVTGIRGGESANREKAPTSSTMKELKRLRRNTDGLQWNPIHPWSTRFVYQYLQEKNFELHEAYRDYRTSRVSCCFCILSKKSDLLAAAGCEDNHDLYREMVDLEIASTFGFQDRYWLGDVAPHLLSEAQRDGLETAKKAAAYRVKVEATIPKDLEYKKGWPQRVPTQSEAELLADVRKKVAGVVDLDAKYLDAASIIKRYETLMAIKEEKSAKGRQKT